MGQKDEDGKSKHDLGQVGIPVDVLLSVCQDDVQVCPEDGVQVCSVDDVPAAGMAVPILWKVGLMIRLWQAGLTILLWKAGLMILLKVEPTILR